MISPVTGSVAVIAKAIVGVLVIIYVAVSAAVVVRMAAGAGGDAGAVVVRIAVDIAVGAVFVRTAVGIGGVVGTVVAVGVGARVAVMTPVGWAPAAGKNVRVPVMAVRGSLETVAARAWQLPGATVGDTVAVAVFVGRNASEIAVALSGTAVGSDVFVAATAELVLVAVGGVTALPWSAANSSSVGTATQPARKSNRQNERRIAIRACIGTSPSVQHRNHRKRLVGDPYLGAIHAWRRDASYIASITELRTAASSASTNGTLLAVQRVQKQLERVRPRLGQLFPRLLAVGAGHVLALEEELAVGDVGMTLRAAHDQR